MTTINSVLRADTGLPSDALARLAQFATSAGTSLPEKITEGAGEDLTFAPDFLSYCNRTGLSLDWLIYGETAKGGVA